MSLNPRRLLSALLALLLFATACDGAVVDPSYEGEPLVTLEGQLTVSPQYSVDKPVRLALAWYPALGNTDPASQVPLSNPKAIVTEDVVYTSVFPVNYSFHLYRPPPESALVPLPEDEGFRGKGAVGILLAYQDGNDNRRLDIIPATGTPVDRVTGASALFASMSWFVAYLDSDQPGASGLKKGFNLVRQSGDGTMTAMPLSTRIPLTVTGAQELNALVCAASFSDSEVVNPCGLGFNTGDPGYAGLFVDGSVALSDASVAVDLSVRLEGRALPNAQVTLGEQPLVYDAERGRYVLDVGADASVFVPGQAVELHIVTARRDRELRRFLNIPGGFDVLSPAPGTPLRGDAPLRAEWSMTSGADAFEVSVLSTSTGVPALVAHANTAEFEYTFDPLRITNSADIVVHAVMINGLYEDWGLVRVKLARSVPVYFE